MGRVKAYYNAISSLIEKVTGLMPIPMINLHHEGFGRVMITVGKLVAFEKTLRDIHRFGFPTLEKMQEEAGKIVTQALGAHRKAPGSCGGVRAQSHAARTDPTGGKPSW